MVDPSHDIDPAKVAVVIPTLNERNYIADTLSQIIEQDPIAARCPVVVADGGSTDGTQDVVTDLCLRHHNLRLIHNPDRIQAAALNMLLSDTYADIEILVRCDAHARYPAGFVSRLVSTIQDKDVASVVIPMDAEAGTNCFQRGLAWIADTKLGAGGSPHRGGVASGYVDHGHHAAFRMSVFRDLGGYDAQFVANEDAEYDHRVIASGHRIWLDGTIRIGYYPRNNARSLWRQYYRYGQGRAQTCFKHAVRPKLRQLIPLLHTLLLAISLLSLPFTALGWIWPVLYTLIIFAAGLVVSVKQGSVCGLAGSLGLAIMHLSWGLGFMGQAARGLMSRTGTRS